MKTIMCYGDSLTWGYIPVTGERYPKDVRWPGVLARELGDEYEIIEEGLSGRTTVFDIFYDPALNGEKPLEAILRSHKPLDLVVLMLGTNDLQFSRTAWEASMGAYRLIKIIRSRPECFRDGKPRILLLAPPHIGKNIAEVDISPLAEHGYEEAGKFAAMYLDVAVSNDCAYLDTGAVAEPSPLDAEHFDEEGHRLMGLAVAQKIKEIFK